MTEVFDVVVIGAGFAGMHMLWRLRQLGLRVVVIERAADVGGTWYWNRYPGCRCDVPSMEYSVPWDPELDQEWDWSERYSGQPEILAYAQRLADRHDLRRDIRFGTTVESVRFDDKREVWQVETEPGNAFEARFCVTAVGCLSTPNLSDIAGIGDFTGVVYHTGRWPHEGVELRGKRVAVLGTGSTGVQASTAIASDAQHLFVLQRSPQYSLPALNRALTDDERRAMRERYPEHRAWQRTSFAAQWSDMPVGPKAFDDDAERRNKVYELAWAAGRQDLVGCYGDIGFDAEVNSEVSAFACRKIREIVKDPTTAEALCPKGQPIGTRRIIMDTGYFEIFNQPNVSLLDIGADPIERFTADGVRLRSGAAQQFDILVVATGYDAVTGALLNLNVIGRQGTRLADAWSEGPRTAFGLMVAGFPSLFTITGPGSPAVHANMIFSIDQHVNWIANCIERLTGENATTIEPTIETQDDWTRHITEVAGRTLRSKDANNWYLGTNIPGKPRAVMTYGGGLNSYRLRIEAVAASGYAGFSISPSRRP